MSVASCQQFEESQVGSREKPGEHQADETEQSSKQRRSKRRLVEEFESNRQLEKGTKHVYNAVRLTNYYTNLLHKQQQQTSTNCDSPGSNWRLKQLAHQIPHQDIKLLASSASGKANTEAEEATGELGESADEIKFIRSQRKLASQFKASLYYLNPVQAAKSGLDSRSAGCRRANDYVRKQSCFKCKLPIEADTTCVRVDNLQVSGHQLTDATLGCHSANTNTCSNSQSKSNNNKNSSQEQKASQADAISPPAKSAPSSSCDEGVGTSSSSAGSSAQSSTAGSHCDDRETPPHVADEPSPQQPSASMSSTAGHLSGVVGRAEKPLGSARSCDNLQLSLNSLSIEADYLRTRDSSSAPSSAGTKRKSRTLTWSASLSSFGASFRSQSKGRAPEAEKEPDCGKTILFHTDCFNCATCNELLVDLRALIYFNEPQQQQMKMPPNRANLQQQASPADCEYVNLPAEDQHGAEEQEQEDMKSPEGVKLNQQLQEQQISLYCHRHFVELFKPRCQQCDCLILDEECTEAEGKVWHIKHFCCTECRVPLGGQQYIIVDQAAAGGRAGRERSPAGATQHNAPYCLQCFDRVFGETCEQCGKLITCDLGAINHEQRCWHASPACFKCQRCDKSLLGSPFLPSADGRIYCSLQCSESTNAACESAKLSLASYCDPRAPQGALQHQLAQTSCAQLLQESGAESVARALARQHKAGLSRHKALIDYLLANARVDETSHQLLNYLHSQFGDSRPAADGGQKAEEAVLMGEIGRALREIQVERADKQRLDESLVSDRRNKLNPFLIDSLGADGKTLAAANYINLELPQPQTAKTAACGTSATAAQPQEHPKQRPVDCVDNGSQHRHQRVRSAGGATLLARQFAYKASQCSPAASLLSNDGTISDHSATSSGVSTAPLASSTNGSLKSHSPLSSTSSHSSVSSAGSSTAAAPSAAAQTQGPSPGGVPAAAAKPPRPAEPEASAGRPRQIQSVAAMLERRRRVQPITELSALDLLSAADDHLQQVQPRQLDGFDQLVSHFENSRRQQTKPLAARAPNDKQQESFFFELAQRLPRQPAKELEPTRALPLDTNGLPEVDTQLRVAAAQTASSRTITDHYSTVNKPHRPQQQQQQAGDFFAITSPLLSCKTDLDPAQVLRPTSSLSVLTPAQDARAGCCSGGLLHAASFSTSSLNRPQQPEGATSQPEGLLLQPSLTSAAKLTKPAKSVSFDPTVKDPPSSSGSLTLGRASALKSALKAPGNWNQQLQQGGSSATMPTSMASQLRAGSLNAYSAYYDEQGRRIRLSSLMNHPMALEGHPFESEQGGEQNKSRSLLSGALSKLNLGGQSSRGGRREERKLRAHQPALIHAFPHEQAAMEGGHIIVQPTSLVQLPDPVASTSGSQFIAHEAPPRDRHPHRSRRTRRSSSRRSAPSHSRGRRGGRSSGSRRRRYCDETDCYDSELSSRCSTCSSDSYSGSDSDSSRCSSDAWSKSDASSGRRSYSARAPYSSCSSSGSDSDSDTSASYSGRLLSSSSSDSDSSSCSSSRSSRCSSPEGGASEASDAVDGRSRRRRSSRRSSSSSSSGRAKRRMKGTRSSADRRHSGSHERHARRRSSRSSSRSSSSRSTSRRSGGSRRRRDHRQRGSGSGRSSSRHHQRRESSGKQQAHERSHSRRATSSRESAAHLEPQQLMILKSPALELPAQNLQHVASGTNRPPSSMNFYPPQQGQVMGQQQHLARAKSPSSLSTDSRLNNEKCRII